MTMKKRSNKARVVLEKMERDTALQAKLIETRRLIGMPTNGFASQAEWFEWMYKNRNKKIKGDFVYEHCNNFEAFAAGRLLKKNLPVPPFLRSFFFLKEIPADITDGAKMSGCEVVPYVKSRWQGEIPNGVYIRIGEHASLSDLKKFIDANANSIHAAQFSVNAIRGIKKRRVRAAKNTERDDIILNYYSRPIKELQGLADSPVTYRSLLIQTILRERHGISIQDDTIRKIISRRRKLGKA